MNQTEFNAMIGVNEGAQAVPTLDDYTVALETLRQRERIAATPTAMPGSWADGLTNANHPFGVNQSMLAQQAAMNQLNQLNQGMGGLNIAYGLETMLGQQSLANRREQTLNELSQLSASERERLVMRELARRGGR